jgi:hypothetical protein
MRSPVGLNPAEISPNQQEMRYRRQHSKRHFRLYSCGSEPMSQLGKALLCKQEVAGSIPAGSIFLVGK